MRPRKYFPHNAVVLATSRMEEGLPLVPSHTMNFIIWGILARAKFLYKVRVSHFVFMGNHFHMILVVDNPRHVSDFIGYVKAETSHAVNQMMGRSKKTIWEKGYGSPLLLTTRDVLKYIRYIYINPVRAGLVDTIESYPGVSSWEMFSTGSYVKTHKKLPRSMINELAFPSSSINEQKRIVESYERQDLAEHDFVLEPFAWVQQFPELKDKPLSELKEDILEDVRAEEERLRGWRNENGKSVIGATTLRRQSMAKEHQPTTTSKRMVCMCSDVPLRKQFISYYKRKAERAREVYQLWREGKTKAQIPAGFFPPQWPLYCCQMTLME